MAVISSTSSPHSNKPSSNDMTPSTTSPTDSPSPSRSSSSPPSLQITVHHRSTPHPFTLSSTATLTDLSTAIATTLAIPPTHQKFLITPSPGLFKPPFPSPPILLSTLLTFPPTKIQLLGSPPAEISSLNETIANAHPRLRNYPIKPATPTRHLRLSPQDALYTFTTLLPLRHLPSPDRSLAFLARLRSDPGITHVMRKNHWTVPLLTEMDPIAHTTHDSRTLGLNRNRGEAIELRLRTDAYDGYRDYASVRATLCHELAHNVFSAHDRDFWDLTRDIERDVRKADWTVGGHRLSEEEFYEPNSLDEEGGEHVDGGGWTGGEFTLGGGGGVNRPVGAGGDDSTPRQPLTRREILARAAEERIRTLRRVRRPDDGADS
ncbi:MAG: hypothetical protein M1817_003664 [Caeruleum heppii]|nr:MAG: hypothetical protein M1817_003664 [Caeruleum heppii]